MIKQIAVIFFLSLLTINAFGQTIEELEYDLSWYHSSEEYGGKIEKAKKLQDIDPFNRVATEYICRYYNDRNIDSVSIYFDNLIAKFPENVEPFLLRSELLFLEIDYRNKDEYNRHKVKYLKQGLNINPKNHLIIYKLAEVYYEDFIFPLKEEEDWGFNFESDNNLIDSTLTVKEKTIEKSTFEHAADSSLYYFHELWKLRKDYRETIYFPIRQLECFLNQSENSQIPKDFEKNINHCYFPISYFANLGKEWECDFTKDYLFKIESGKGTAEWLEIQLKDLKENCLFNKKVKPETTIYRFTWLRSFHHPIAIRIENIENEITLFWKVGKGAGGYEPQGLKKSRKKKLSLNEWGNFEQLLRESRFDSLPNDNYVLMTDGATWTLEKKKYDSFKAHNTNLPNKEFKEACLYLLSLTNIKIKEEDKY